MISITKRKKNVIISFPEESVSRQYVEKFLDFLKFVELTSKNEMTEKDAVRLSEELKENWWNANREKFLKRIKK